MRRRTFHEKTDRGLSPWVIPLAVVSASAKSQTDKAKLEELNAMIDELQREGETVLPPEEHLTNLIGDSDRIQNSGMIGPSKAIVEDLVTKIPKEIQWRQLMLPQILREDGNDVVLPAGRFFIFENKLSQDEARNIMKKTLNCFIPAMLHASLEGSYVAVFGELLLSSPGELSTHPAVDNMHRENVWPSWHFRYWVYTNHENPAQINYCLGDVVATAHIQYNKSAVLDEAPTADNFTVVKRYVTVAPPHARQTLYRLQDPHVIYSQFGVGPKVPESTEGVHESLTRLKGNRAAVMRSATVKEVKEARNKYRETAVKHPTVLQVPRKPEVAPSQRGVRA